MARFERLILFLLAAVLTACANVPEITVSVRECAPLPAEGRASACACVLDGKAYVFAGREKGYAYLNDLWQYDPSTDSWTNLGAAPMTKRVNATMTAYNGKLYLGLGYSATRAYVSDAYLQDWWEYNPATQQWKQLADYPTKYTVAPTSFALGERIYVIYGFSHGFSQHIYLYNPATNSWTTWEDNPKRAKANAGGRGAWFGGLFYYGGGYNTHNLNQWFATDIAADEWTPRASIPGKGREFSACAASKKYIYLFGGRHFGGDMSGGEIFESYLRYSPDKDQWEWCGVMPAGRAENQIAFSIDGKVYFGLGENADGQPTNKIYCIDE